MVSSSSMSDESDKGSINLAKRVAEGHGQREFIISSRGKRVYRAWSQPAAKLDASSFLLWIYAWCPLMNSWYEASRHGAIFVSRQYTLCRRWPRCTFMLYSWRANVFNHRLWNNVYDRRITSNFPCKWHRTASATSGWKSSPAKIFHWNFSGERRLKFILSGENDDNNKPRSRENIA